MSDAHINDLIDPNWLTPYHFDDKPAVVEISRVTIEEVWNRRTGKFDELKIIYIKGHNKGLKTPPTQLRIVESHFGPKTANWIGKLIHLVHIEEEAFGNKYYLTRIDPDFIPQQPQEDQEQIPKAASDEQVQIVEKFGLQAYGEEWNTKRGELAYALSERTTDLETLYEVEIQRMINGIMKKIKSDSAEASESTEDHSVDSQNDEDDNIPEGEEIDFF